MLSIEELRPLARRLSAAHFRKQMGPFALVQRPPPEALAGHPGLAKSTVVSQRAPDQADALALILEFDDLVVYTLPPMRTEDQLTVGRLPACDIVLDDPSVSKQHALLRWDEAADRCTARDLGSRNGTWLNGQRVRESESVLHDGDVLSFGDVDYWYLLVHTLHAKLQGLPSHGASS